MLAPNAVAANLYSGLAGWTTIGCAPGLVVFMRGPAIVSKDCWPELACEFFGVRLRMSTYCATAIGDLNVVYWQLTSSSEVAPTRIDGRGSESWHLLTPAPALLRVTMAIVLFSTSLSHNHSYSSSKVKDSLFRSLSIVISREKTYATPHTRLSILGHDVNALLVT